MSKRTTAFCAALCAISINLYAQTVTFIDQTTRAPVPDVTLTCKATGKVLTTTADGRVDIAPLKGCDSIRIDHLSYTPITMAWAALAAKPEVDLGYRVNMLREVVTSGSRFTEPKRDVPEQIDVLGRRGVNFMAQPTAAALLWNDTRFFGRFAGNSDICHPLTKRGLKNNAKCRPASAFREKAKKAAPTITW